MDLKNWLKFIVLALIWGTSFLWIRLAVPDVGPFILVFFRILFAFLGILAFFLIRRVRFKLTWRFLLIFTILGLFNVALPFVLISWAEESIPSGLASVMNSTVPLFTLIFITMFLPEERSGWFRTLGLILGFGGVVVLMSSGFSGGEGGRGILLGIGGMLVAAMCYGACGVFARLKTRGMQAEEQSLGQTGMALFFITVATSLFEHDLRLPAKPITWVALVWLGLLGSAVATVLYFSMLNSVGPTRTVLVAYVFPVIAVVLGILILHEPFNWQIVVGGAMVLLSVLWVNYLRSPAQLKAVLARFRKVV
jgi:drug/metabolite transporter (DMT)-like permease